MQRYDTNCANAFIVTKRNRNEYEQSTLTLFNDESDSDESIDIIENCKLTRQYFYSKVLEKIEDEPMRKLFTLHLKMLEKLPLCKRACLPNVDVTALKQQYPNVSATVQTFKFALAKLLKSINRMYEFIEVEPRFGAEIADLFDIRLFWKTYEQLNHSNGQLLEKWAFDSHVNDQKNTE